jgi:hypothetical protein
VRQLSIASADEQRAWLRARLQPYRIEPLSGPADGLLTSYFEPVFDASRKARAGYTVPLYRPPANLGARRPWYTRQEIDTLPEPRAALAGREIAWLADPIDALMLQIQGSGRLRVTEPDGSVRMVRMAYAGTNDQPYQSVGRWLLDQGAVRDASWPGIKAWLAQNPQRTQALLWSNPRVVFFREEPLTGLDAAFGPRGAQGVPLTPGRSIAVDPQSIPYGTPVWLASNGPQTSLNRLVMARTPAAPSSVRCAQTGSPAGGPRRGNSPGGSSSRCGCGCCGPGSWIRQAGALGCRKKAGPLGHALPAAVAHLAGHGGQHHAVGDVGVGAVVGLDPADAAGLAEGQAVGAGEVVGRRSGPTGSPGSRGGIGLSAKQVHVPVEAGDRSAFLQRTMWPLGLPFCGRRALHVGVGAGVGASGRYWLPLGLTLRLLLLVSVK